MFYQLKVIEKLEIKTGKSSEKVNSPMIIKQVCPCGSGKKYKKCCER